MRRMIAEDEALRPDRQIIDAVAAREAGTVVNLTAARQMICRQHRHDVLPCQGRPHWQRQTSSTLRNQEAPRLQHICWR